MEIGNAIVQQRRLYAGLGEAALTTEAIQRMPCYGVANSMCSRRTEHEAYVFARAVVFSAILATQGVAAEERPDVPFVGGDIIVRTQECLSLIRDRTQVTTFGVAWHIGSDA